MPTERSFDGLCLACGKEPALPDAFLCVACLPLPAREDEPDVWQPNLPEAA